MLPKTTYLFRSKRVVSAHSPACGKARELSSISSFTTHAQLFPDSTPKNRGQDRGYIVVSINSKTIISPIKTLEATRKFTKVLLRISGRHGPQERKTGEARYVA